MITTAKTDNQKIISKNRQIATEILLSIEDILNEYDISLPYTLGDEYYTLEDQIIKVLTNDNHR